MRAVFAVIVLVWGSNSNVHACSCLGASRWFLVEPETTLPLNNVVVPWFANSSRTPTLDDFEVELISASDAVATDFDLISDESNPIHSNIVLVRILNPMPNARYQISYHGLQSVIVVVSADSIQLDSLEPSSLLITVSKGKDIPVTTLGGSCGVSVDGTQANLEMLLPEALQKWIGTLLFATGIVGVEEWKPTKSLCAHVPPGVSWVGRGIDLVFATDDRRPAYYLEYGTYEIAMTVWVPGTDVTSLATGAVELVE